MRVAVCQFASTDSVENNLSTSIRMINEAAAGKADVIVLPEYCNAPCWYQDHNQAWQSALSLEGSFLQTIAEQAKQHHCYISLGVTLRRDDMREHQNGDVKSNISVSSCLFAPSGALIAHSDKQILIGCEQDFFVCTSAKSTITDTELGNIGLLVGNDSLGFEQARAMTLAGAQILCHSTSTFAVDQSSLHSPARASENKVFIASANKVGMLIEPAHHDAFLAQYTLSESYLVAVGQSQILSSTGAVLAQMSANEEGVIWADINLADANTKKRPDGSDILKQRRPELYQTLLSSNNNSKNTHAARVAPNTVNTAIFATYTNHEQALEDVCFYIENNLSDIIQLPELFFLADKSVCENSEQRSALESFSKTVERQISQVLRPFQYVCTSLVIDGKHQAVLISEQGIIAMQQQLHFCQRYQWTELGNHLNIIEVPLEQGCITIAMLTADDANIAEIVKIAAIKGIHVLLVPFDVQEASEVQYQLLARAAENRICLLGATREKSLTNNATAASLIFEANRAQKQGNHKQVKAHKSTGFIANLSADFTLFTQWQGRKPSGSINQPIVKPQFGKITKALVQPNTSTNKLLAVNYSVLTV
ncbi:carbon-nitrogen hydrolase [Colwellia sp. D2M02]|uniref:nitrilase-related carbon-nitrogen hydrolase n=1 Tax=Colwellia sp. D2M02 TaxID=2841562 RepID=UPI001C08F5E2|nr:nitrilase-related carbon-nitrogen hydrolase [Colwellia sp. D2M02]MBU2892760.1 carbon-nitrogen hydrolase [Colwellia sp. D2M02]